MKIALYFEDQPDGTVRMQRKDLAGQSSDGEAASIVLVAQDAVRDFMLRQNRQRREEDTDIEPSDADLSQAEKILRAFGG
ncbi:hypothetical protein OPIT5_03905 [Opitutaceae bacterium TAV5]|nr:hypothetical protein OPIT5_03905 [Opitutaceae bacterium TAV5]